MRCCQTQLYDTALAMQDDMDVMFDNAMAYNLPDTVYHKQARSLKAVAAKMVDLAKQGVTDFRYVKQIIHSCKTLPHVLKTLYTLHQDLTVLGPNTFGVAHHIRPFLHCVTCTARHMCR